MLHISQLYSKVDLAVASAADAGEIMLSQSLASAQAKLEDGGPSAWLNAVENCLNEWFSEDKKNTVLASQLRSIAKEVAASQAAIKRDSTYIAPIFVIFGIFLLAIVIYILVEKYA